VVGGVQTETYYIGNLEEVSVARSSTTPTTYYYAGNGGPRIATPTNGVFNYLASDALGTAEVALDAHGNTTAATLDAPYGTAR
jgi:hypothetical protein